MQLVIVNLLVEATEHEIAITGVPADALDPIVCSLDLMLNNI